MATNILIDILAIDNASRTFDKVAASAERSGGSVSKFTKGVGLTLGAVAIAAGTAAVAAIKMGSEFQRSMELLHTQAGVSQKEVDSLSKSVLNLAGPTATAPQQLAEALFHIESSGYRGATALTILKTAAEGAKVGNANLVDVTNSLSAAVVSGIPGVQNMQQAMGALNAIVGAGDMHMQDLAEALSGTGLLAVAKSFGVTMTDVGGALATFGDNGIRGTDAATQLRMAILALAKPVKGGEDALKSIGITAGQLGKDMQTGGLNQAITDLHDHLVAAGDTGTKAGQVLTDAFGRKAGVGITTLISQYDRFEQKIGDVQKGAQDFGAAWTATTHTLSFQFDQARAESEALLTSIGMHLIPILEQAAVKAESAAKTIGSDLSAAWHTLSGDLGDLKTPFSEVISDIGKIIADLKPLGMVVAGLGWSALRVTAMAVGTAFRLFADVLGVVVSAANHLKPVLWALAAAFVAIKVQSLVSSIPLLVASLKGVALAAADATAALGANFVAGLASLASPVGLATLAVAGLSFGIYQGIRAQEAAARAAKKWAQSLGESTDPSNYKSLTLLNDAYDKSQKTFDTTATHLKELNKTITASAGTNASAAGGTKDLNSSLRAAAAQVDVNKTKIGGLNSALKDSVRQQADLNTKWNQAGSELHLTAGQAYILAQKYGIDLNGSVKDVTAALKAATGAGGEAAASGKELADADRAVGNTAQAAADAANALSAALKGLNGDQIDATEAQNNLVQSIGDIKTQLDSASRSLNGNTVAGAKNQNALLDLFKSAQDVANAQVQAGATSDVATAAYNKNYASIVAAARAAGLNATQIAAMVQQYHLTPAEVDTVIKNNAPAAAAAVDAYKASLDAVNGKTITSKMILSLEAQGLDYITAVDRAGAGAKAARLNAAGGYQTGPGTGASDSILSWLSNGEYVVNAKATAKNRALLDLINGTSGGSAPTPVSAPAGRTSTTSSAGSAPLIGELHVHDEVGLDLALQKLEFRLGRQPV